MLILTGGSPILGVGDLEEAEWGYLVSASWHLGPIWEDAKAQAIMTGVRIIGRLAHSLSWLLVLAVPLSSAGSGWYVLPHVVSLWGLVWASSQHGGWVLSTSILRETGEAVLLFMSQPLKSYSTTSTKVTGPPTFEERKHKPKLLNERASRSHYKKSTQKRKVLSWVYLEEEYATPSVFVPHWDNSEVCSPWFFQVSPLDWLSASHSSDPFINTHMAGFSSVLVSLSLFLHLYFLGSPANYCLHPSLCQWTVSGKTEIREIESFYSVKLESNTVATT